MKLPWFKRSSSSTKGLKVFFEVHQNGEILSKTSRPFEKNSRIYLSSNPEAELNAPYYPLPYDIKIATITRRGVELQLDPTWQGFTTCDGKIEDINSDRKSHYTHIMKRGDYGSIAHNDLRVLIRVGREREPRKHTPPKKFEYPGSLIELWLGGTYELRFLAVGVLASMWIIGGFSLGLRRHGDISPKSFIELENHYTLPFIHPQHLSFAPESLQNQYNRDHPIQASLDFISSFVDTLTGKQKANGENRSDALFPQSRERYTQLYGKQQQDIKELEQNHKKKLATVMGDPRNAVLSIPLVKGEAFTETLLRIQDKATIWYEGTAQNKARRDRIAKIFLNDPKYDPKQWKDLEKNASPKVDMYEQKGRDRQLALMYGEAQKLADNAKSMQQEIANKSAHVPSLNRETAFSPRINAAEAFAELSTPSDFNAFNTKLGLIQAAIFDPDKPKVVREPLIGSLDPRKIQETVDKYRFELQLCYELALRRNQQLSGSMEWQWHLDSTGDIYDIELLQSSIQDQQMIQCVKQKIASWNWPKPQKGSIQISFPFHFKPAKG